MMAVRHDEKVNMVLGMIQEDEFQKKLTANLRREY